MAGRISYPSKYSQYANAFAILRIAACILVSQLISQTSFAHNDGDYDEISVYINVQGVGSIELPAVIHNEVIYLSVTDVFNFLKIKNNLSHGFDSLSGFLITPQAVFLIDKIHHQILFHQTVYKTTEEYLIYTETNIYLRSDYFGKVFGLDCVFNFRSLSVSLSTKLELPVIAEMRQEAMHNNIKQLRGEVKADTIIRRSYPLFRLGMADWSAVSSQYTNAPADNRLNLTTGVVFAGGETDLSFNYDNNSAFREKDQFYEWHLVNNDNSGLRQAMAGKIFAQSISSIYSPVVGVQFTNTPTIYRRSFGTYTLSNHTQPGWTVELYVNNVLVNYVVADASGFFTFQVPLIYGNSVVKLRFYGSFGEQRSSEQNIAIPFNFLPRHQFEYNATAGIVEDSLGSKFARIALNYGVDKTITIGGGMEYLSSVTSGKNIPFANVSARLGSNMLFYGEYDYGVQSKAILSYHLPSNFQIEVDYTRYKKGQTAINNTFLEERKAIISFPFQGKKLSVFSRVTVYQIVLPALIKFAPTKYTTVEGLLSGMAFGVNVSLTTYALLTPQSLPYIYSNLSTNMRLPGKLIFTPQVQYAYTGGAFIDIKGELGKFISSRGFMNIFYEDNYKSQFKSIGLSFRYAFSFAQTGFSTTHSNQGSTMVQSGSGSLMYDGNSHHLNATNRPSVGRGGILVIPYLDLNGNGKRDKGETLVEGLRMQLNGGRIIYNKDTSIRVTDLEGNVGYTIALSTDGLENVAWRVKNKIINITITPNQVSLVNVPVTVAGEALGTINLKDDDGQKGLGRITVNLYRDNSIAVAKSLSESDGTFSFAGLAPGSYTAKVDDVQMKKLHLIAMPAALHLTITASREGDVVDGLDFTLKPARESGLD